MTASELIRAALPGIIVGCGLSVIGALIGRAIGPGWTDLMQASAFFIGLIWALIGVRRKASMTKRSES
jgi:hypothetical protein